MFQTMVLHFDSPKSTPTSKGVERLPSKDRTFLMMYIHESIEFSEERQEDERLNPREKGWRALTRRCSAEPIPKR